jgi:hypothetical protein
VRNPGVEEPVDLCFEHADFHFVPVGIVLGVAAMSGTVNERFLLAVTGVTGHYAEVVGDETLFADPI